MHHIVHNNEILREMLDNRATLYFNTKAKKTNRRDLAYSISTVSSKLITNILLSAICNTLHRELVAFSIPYIEN
jgi:hypothetical protein